MVIVSNFRSGVIHTFAHDPKLTFSIDDRVYAGPHSLLGRGNIAKFLEDWPRPFVVTDSLAAAYAEMSGDLARDGEAQEWCESLAGDGSDAAW